MVSRQPITPNVHTSKVNSVFKENLLHLLSSASMISPQLYSVGKSLSGNLCIVSRLSCLLFKRGNT